MILAAGLLVLVGLGLFLAGVLTGTTAFYWACVAVCVLAAVLLFGARRRIASAEAALPAPRTAAASPPTAPPSGPATTTATVDPPAADEPASATPAGATAVAATADPTAGPTVEAAEPVADPPPTGAHARPGAPASVPVTPQTLADPPIEDVEVTDLLLVVDLKDDVVVVDEHPRYHLAGCRFLAGKTGIPLPLDEARVDGFTPCALCAPDRNLADRERARKAGRAGT